MNKFKKLLTILFASVTVAGGIAAGSIEFKTSENNVGVKEVKADGIPETIYFTISSSWNGGRERLVDCYVYFNGNEVNKQISAIIAEDSENNGVVYTGGVPFIKLKVPSNTTKVKFNNGETGWDFPGFPSQTSNLSIPTDGSDAFTLSSNSGAGNQTGYWSTFSSLSNDIPSRIFVDISASKWMDWTRMGNRAYENLYAYFYNSNGDVDASWPGKKITYTSTKLDYGRRYLDDLYTRPTGGYDQDRYIFLTSVPSAATGVVIKCFGDDYVQNKSVNLDLPTGVDKSKNLISVYGQNNDNYAQDAVFKDNPYEIPDQIFFKYTGTYWQNNKNIPITDLRAHFYGQYGETTIWPGEAGYSNIYTVDGVQYKKFDVPKWATRVIFNVAVNRSGNQYQSEEQVLLADDTLGYTITTTSGSSAQSIGYDDSIEDAFITSETSPSSSTSRLFVNNTAMCVSDPNPVWRYTGGDYFYYGVRCWGGDNSSSEDSPTPAKCSTIYKLTWFDGLGTERTANESSSRWYGYADIPINTLYFRFVIVRTSDNQLIYTTSNCIEVDQNTFSTCFFILGKRGNINTAEKEDRYGKIVPASIDVNNVQENDCKVGQGLVEKLLLSYDTCSDSDFNGYGNVDNLVLSYCLENPTTDAATAEYHTFETITPVDPGYPQGGYTKPLSYIISMMRIRNGGSSSIANRLGYFGSLFSENNDSSVIIIIIASSLSLLSITALSILLIKKRKSKER